MADLVEIPRPSVLVSNSTLYFASRLLEGALPVNAMTVFNLATFCEAIALGETVYTLPPLQVNHSKILKELNGRGIVREVPVDKSLGPALSLSRAPHGNTDHDQEVRAARILSHVLPFSPDVLTRILVRAPDWADTNWSTPNWDEVQQWFEEPINNETTFDDPFRLGFEGLTELGSTDVGNIMQELVCNIYSRTGIYMQASSLYRLSLLADSFRTELIQEFNRDLHTRFTGLIDGLIASIEIPEMERTKLLNAQNSYEEFDIVVPSFLFLALRDCNSREVFLESALELRRAAKRIRSRIGDVERAQEFKTKDRKEKLAQTIKEFSQSEGQRTGNQHIESLMIQTIPELSISPDILAKLGLEASSIFLQHFKNRHLSIVHDLKTRIRGVASMNDDLERVFRRHLSKTESQLLQRLLEARWSRPLK